MSADEIDAELLGLVGDSSDAESEVDDVSQLQQPISARSPSEEPKPSVEKPAEEPASERRKGVAQKVRKRGKKKVSRRELEDELDDLGDGSPSPQPSLGSDAMSESASEADAPASPEAVEEGPAFPIEGKFTSASDRDHILSLPEIEREEILAERAQVNIKRQQDLQLKKALAASQAAASKHKRKAAAADLDDGVRKSSRPKTEKASALDSYKKAREAKGAERTSRFDSKRDRKDDDRSPSAGASDRDAEGESEVEWAEPSSDARRSDRDEPPADLRDFERCRIGRSNFAKVCFYPNFENTMKGCFCRVSIGLNRETGQNMYRMTQIKGFAEGKPYSLELPSGKTFTTDQYALVSHGSAEKPWPFSACSDSRFSPLEFDRYRETLEKEHVRLPKRAWLEQKLSDIHRFLNVEWTDSVLQGKFARQRAMERKVDPANAAKVKREAILKRRSEAEDQGDEEEVRRCEAELAGLENNAMNGNGESAAIKAKPSPMRPTAHISQERLALLNQKNRDKNAEDIRKALLEERRKLHAEREKARAEAKAKKEAEEAKKFLGVPGDDLKDLFGDSDISRAGTPMSGTSTPNRRMRAGTPLNGLGGVKKERSGLSGAKKKAGMDDELASLDLGIDVEI